LLVHNLQITRAGFWGKGNKVYYLSDKEEHRESQPLNVPSLHFWEKMSAFKGEFRGSAWLRDQVHVHHNHWPWFSRCPDTSLKLYVYCQVYCSLVRKT
jgi:hypothetical protein